MTDTQRVFLLSPANGAPYIEPAEIDQAPIRWPADTWLQRRRKELAKKEGSENG